MIIVFLLSMSGESIHRKSLPHPRVTPVLQGTTWDGFATDVSSINNYTDVFTQHDIDRYDQQVIPDYDANTSLLRVQEQVQRWADDTVSSQPASSPATLQGDDEKICYGLVCTPVQVKSHC